MSERNYIYIDYIIKKKKLSPKDIESSLTKFIFKLKKKYKIKTNYVQPNQIYIYVSRIQHIQNIDLIEKKIKYKKKIYPI